ncbi:MAG: pre-16S rRNA-processing nuclease YqgF [Oscillatoriales cyanobacterium]|uniref:Pre-16S rRNA-processing nuclease YqgF n=1 Tax=Microcoleus anatoxicus PTRS2 TaxID=2705321 RepID=A0ABU8YS22_9CYAN|nr:MAG: pre-16S rRNA-processing nuclease YqgF [Oscillatoriales cyanobacterium]TAD97524.1 MAG: pre-16S rRNA-processing nuclease YqgF [Oscillatoriales cyanobacterium]TAE06280.1 MAG: pre-16S rRNA-processing nuclease YqgF [Oscillatoriales cyanobacterium]TAF04202.1 MAG: pre-16S rRNA-processing nuclease YqgF [Oscillatoriales cyanobacterium]TAF45412.1 MAG: pre-16S rRNA-processing nuclease YqgF [Oscillatoriales cyanobacterium]
MILGFDPGKDKCGVAVMGTDNNISYHQVVPSESAISTIQSLCEQFPIDLLVMGDQTTSKKWKQKLTQSLSPSIAIIQIDERYSSLEAKERYWQMYPATGLNRLIPLGMRTPPRPVDDIVAIVLIERYLNQTGLTQPIH